jgi:hypothetical protein
VRLVYNVATGAAEVKSQLGDTAEELAGLRLRTQQDGLLAIEVRGRCLAGSRVGPR